MLITTTTTGKPTSIDLTDAHGIAALTLLREQSDASLGAALTPEQARSLADALHAFATRHGH